jgi:hypothetical protein
VTERPPVAGVSYAAFAVHPRHPGNLRGFAIGHRVGEKFVLALVHGDISVETASAILKRYGVSKITCSDDVDETPLALAVAGVFGVLRRKL